MGHLEHLCGATEKKASQGGCQDLRSSRSEETSSLPKEKNSLVIHHMDPIVHNFV